MSPICQPKKNHTKTKNEKTEKEKKNIIKNGIRHTNVSAKIKIQQFKLLILVTEMKITINLSEEEEFHQKWNKIHK